MGEAGEGIREVMARKATANEIKKKAKDELLEENNRQFRNHMAAKAYVLGCLISTLENDINGNGADYLYDNLPTDEDRVLAVAAARQVLKRLQSMVVKK